MRPRLPLTLTLTAFLLLSLVPAFPQLASPNESASIRVNVTVNPDGSRTTYRFDTANHKATAATVGSDGKVLGKTNYRLDEANRFGSSVSFSGDGKFRLKSIYKYDPAGRLAEETQLAQDDSLLNKIVYSYDSSGNQIGYAIYDASGKLVGGQTAPQPKKK